MRNIAAKSVDPDSGRSTDVRFEKKKNSQMTAAIAQSPTYGTQTQKSSLSTIALRVSGAIAARSSAVAGLRFARISCCASSMPASEPTGLNICAKLSRLTAVSGAPRASTYGLHVVSSTAHPPATMNIPAMYSQKLCAMQAGT